MYTLIGGIVACFVAIVIAGSIRHRRHPERYSPRYNATGQVQRSRAKGIARAMLETIPIVRFGDQDEGAQHAAARDIEMSQNHGAHGNGHYSTGTGIGSTCTPTQADETVSSAETNTEDQFAIVPGARRSPSPAPDASDSCPICTDEFFKGQDLRLLPCKHSFHPDCVDPWLVNVSGTCPVW